MTSILRPIIANVWIAVLAALLPATAIAADVGGTRLPAPAALLGGQLDPADDVIVEAQDPDPDGKGTAGDPLQFLWRERAGKIVERENHPPPEAEESKNPVLDSDRRPGHRYDYEDSNARGWRSSGTAIYDRSGAEAAYDRGKAGDYESHRGAAGGSDLDPGRAGEEEYRRGAAGYRGED